MDLYGGLKWEFTTGSESPNHEAMKFLDPRKIKNILKRELIEVSLDREDQGASFKPNCDFFLSFTTAPTHLPRGRTVKRQRRGR